MTSDRECYVYITPPGEINFVTAGRFRVSTNRDGVNVGEFIYRKRYRERKDAVALDPVELRLEEGTFGLPSSVVKMIVGTILASNMLC